MPDFETTDEIQDLTRDREIAIKALLTIRGILGYGIKGCPTNGKYHAKSYSQAYDIAKTALESLSEG